MFVLGFGLRFWSFGFQVQGVGFGSRVPHLADVDLDTEGEVSVGGLKVWISRRKLKRGQVLSG